MGFFELPEEDQPPEGLYGNDKRLTEWFDGVKYRRANPDRPGMEPVPEAGAVDVRNTLLDDLGLRD